MPSSCRLLPHGGYSLLPAVLTTMGWISALFQEGCDFAILTGPTVANWGVDVPWLEVGFQAYREPVYDENGTWRTVYGGSCLEYPSPDPVDSIWQVSKGLNFVAVVLGGAGTFYLWFATLCVFSKATWRLAGLEVGLASVFQGLSFLWFRTELCGENDCTLGRGSQADIVASTFWMLAAILIYCHYPPVTAVVTTAEPTGDGIVRTTPSVAIDDGVGGPPRVTTERKVREVETPMSSGQDSREYDEDAML